MILKNASTICLLGTLFILTGCATSTPTATVVGISNPPINYTYARGFSPPQVMYPDPIMDSDNVPNKVNRDKRLAPAVTMQQLQQRLLIEQQQSTMIIQDSSVF